MDIQTSKAPVASAVILFFLGEAKDAASVVLSLPAGLAGDANFKALGCEYADTKDQAKCLLGESVGKCMCILVNVCNNYSSE
jgi:hypothetical protein